ncbi:hypothetical protein JTB14_019234 [Gonioctena quinquepunctata]|nr:hypothetical protein JTB14_019234 [Gonioctena quinquepunctata]
MKKKITTQETTNNTMLTQNATTHHNYTQKKTQILHTTPTKLDTLETTTELLQEHTGILDHITQPESSTTAGDFKLTCCGTIDELDTNKSLDISILEQTISEISEESNIRGKHIEKLRKENEIFNEEAVQREEELVQIIKQQEIAIQQAERKIGLMEKN